MVGGKALAPAPGEKGVEVPLGEEKKREKGGRGVTTQKEGTINVNFPFSEKKGRKKNMIAPPQEVSLSSPK